MGLRPTVWKTQLNYLNSLFWFHLASTDGLEAKYTESAFHGQGSLPARRSEDMSFEQMLLDMKKKMSQRKNDLKRHDDKPWRRAAAILTSSDSSTDARVSAMTLTPVNLTAVVRAIQKTIADFEMILLTLCTFFYSSSLNLVHFFPFSLVRLPHCTY